VAVVAAAAVSRDDGGPALTIALDDFLWFVDVALDAMVAIVQELGDERANRRPALPDANSAFAILTHCLGVMEYWGGAMIAGRRITRDRDAEFRATGEVADVVRRAREARARLRDDLMHLDPCAAPRGEFTYPEDANTPLRTQGGVLVHVYEELAQHLGQMQLTRDVVLHEAGH
jgi:hypothetical protein